MTRYVVQERAHRRYVVVDRTNGAVVSPELSRKEAQREVWELNGRKGSFRA